MIHPHKDVCHGVIGGMPAACVGDLAVCAGLPDTIALGSFKVLIGGKPAARLGEI